MALNPNYPPYYLGNLGYVLRLAGQVGEAITAFKATYAQVPGSGFGLTDLVILYQQSGQPDEARQTAERFLSARPEQRSRRPRECPSCGATGRGHRGRPQPRLGFLRRRARAYRLPSECLLIQEG